MSDGEFRREEVAISTSPVKIFPLTSSRVPISLLLLEVPIRRRFRGQVTGLINIRIEPKNTPPPFLTLHIHHHWCIFNCMLSEFRKLLKPVLFLELVRSFNMMLFDSKFAGPEFGASLHFHDSFSRVLFCYCIIIVVNDKDSAPMFSGVT